MNRFSAIIQKEKDLYVSTCVELGVSSQGETIEEALENLKEATELYIEEMPHLLEDGNQSLFTTFSIGDYSNVKV